MIDKRDVTFVGGKGGDGSTAIRDLGPWGGSGGRGGRLFLEGDSNKYDLGYVKNAQVFQAWDGEKGNIKGLDGKKGRDLIIQVPLVSNIYNEKGELIAEISRPGQRVLLCRGGTGGYGNLFLKKNRDKVKKGAILGEPGDRIKAKIELNLTADVIFIGFPNAGKSSILNSLTNASAKVAHYEFTTLNPNLGFAGRLKLMDLPGLIEGTHEGKGLGTGFIKHTRYAKLVAHFLSLEDWNLADRYMRMRQELGKIDERLLDIPEVIVLTKADLVDDQDVLEELKAQLKGFGKRIVVTSSASQTYSEDVADAFAEEIAKA